MPSNNATDPTLATSMLPSCAASIIGVPPGNLTKLGESPIFSKSFRSRATNISQSGCS